MPQDGLVTVSSRYPARDTMERLLLALAKRNMTVFARVDHAAGAASAGLSLRPTEVVIFGNPKGGTALIVHFTDCERRFHAMVSAHFV